MLIITFSVALAAAPPAPAFPADASIQASSGYLFEDMPTDPKKARRWEASLIWPPAANATAYVVARKRKKGKAAVLARVPASKRPYWSGVVEGEPTLQVWAVGKGGKSAVLEVSLRGLDASWSAFDRLLEEEALARASSLDGTGFAEGRLTMKNDFGPVGVGGPSATAEDRPQDKPPVVSPSIASLGPTWIHKGAYKSPSVRAGFAPLADAVRDCVKKPTRVIVWFDLSPTGRPLAVQVGQVKKHEQTCLTPHIEALRFDPPKGAVSVEQRLTIEPRSTR